MNIATMLSSLEGSEVEVETLARQICDGFRASSDLLGVWSDDRILNGRAAPDAFLDYDNVQASNLFCAGFREDGFLFLGAYVGGSYRVWAGCRDFYIEEAQDHWKIGSERSRARRLWSLQAVERIEDWMRSHESSAVKAPLPPTPVLPPPAESNIGYDVHVEFGFTDEIKLVAGERHIWLDATALRNLVAFAKSHGWEV